MRMNFIKKSVVTITAISCLFNTFLFNDSAEATTTAPNSYGRDAGWINNRYGVEDSEESRITGTSINDYAYLTIADVIYSGAKSGTGRVNNYSRASTTADNGYPIVDMAEAREWARLFNGNPSFLTNENGLYGLSITGGGGSDYTGYLLAKVAEMSGGKGDPYSFRPTRTGEKGSYVGVTKFTTTQRPVGGVQTDKTKYNVGENVKVTAWGRDYSIYNRGMVVVNYYIYNLDTGQAEYTFTNARGDYPISGVGDGSGQQINFPIQNWTPTKAGNYEARILLTDSHARNTQNAPAVDGQGVAYHYKFTVGNPTQPPPGGGGQDPGPTCDVNSYQNVMDIYVNGENGNYTYNDRPSNGSTLMVSDGDRVFFTFYEEGTFYVNGNKLPTPSNGDKKQGMWDVVGSPLETFTITFESADGGNCWTHKFQIKGNGDEKECPVVKDSTNYNRARTVYNGEVLTSYLGADIFYHSDNTSGGNFSLFEKDPDDGSIYAGAEVWLVQYPGQSTYTKVFENSAMQTLDVGPAGIILNKAGTYKIKIQFDGGMNEDLECEWEVTLEVKNCTLKWPNTFKYYGTPPNTTSAGVASNLIEGIGPVDFRQITNENGTLNTNIVFVAPVAGKYYEIRGMTRTLIGTSAAKYAYTAKITGGYSSYSAGDTIVIAFVPDDPTYCETIFNIQTAEGNTGGGSGCYEVTMTYGGRTIDPRTAPIPLKITKDDLNGDFKIYFKFAKKASLWVGWYNPEGVTGNPTYQHMQSDKKDVYESYFIIPQDKDGNIESLIYKATWRSQTMEDETGEDPCAGEIIIEVEGDKPAGENLWVNPNVIDIRVCKDRRDEVICSSSNGAPKPGDSIEITTYYGNDGKFDHKPRFVMRWKDGKNINSNYIKIKAYEDNQPFVGPATYPSKKTILEACINDDKRNPEEEIRWDDNCAQWELNPDGTIDPVGGSKENLAVDPDYFKITPKDPQNAGTAAEVEVRVMNKGDSTQSSKVLLKFDKESKSQTVDVTGLKSGESKIIKVSVVYPDVSMNFTANINPNKNSPSNESNWKDNTGSWPVLVNGSPPPGGGGDGGGPGGNIPGGQMKIRVYDSGDRLLNLPNDGVYEKEKARIEVEIDQDKIDQAMDQVNQQINNAINEKRAELESTYSGDEYKNVNVSVNPTSWNAMGSSMTNWPLTTPMTVNGPGIDQTYSLNTNQQVQSSYYHGTTVPTNRDRVQELLAEKYVVKAEGFKIIANYRVDFEVTYEQCEEIENDEGDVEETCTPGSDSDSIANAYTITIEGAQTQFEVYDLWVKGYVKHTDRWDALRKAYNTQKTGNPESPRTYDVFWGGEKFILYADSTNTGTSPVKGATLKVTMSTTNLTSDLTSSDKTTWNGDMWRDNFDKLRNGTYIFTFVLTYNHTGPDGRYHVETDTVPIRILNPVWEVVKTNRIH